MGKRDKVTETIAVRVTADDRIILEELSAKYDLSLSQIIRRALVDYLKKLEENKEKIV